MYKFNDTLDRYALKPVAKAYRDHVPKPVQTGVGNFFTNLSYPATVVNQFLQGKFKEGGQDVLRLVINTTLGWGGIFDVASGARLPHSRRGLWADPWTLGGAPGPVPGVAVPRPGDVARYSGAYRRRFLPALPLV